jgi:hypothetical protein
MPFIFRSLTCRFADQRRIDLAVVVALIADLLAKAGDLLLTGQRGNLGEKGALAGFGHPPATDPSDQRVDLAPIIRDKPIRRGKFIRKRNG